MVALAVVSGSLRHGCWYLLIGKKCVEVHSKIEKMRAIARCTHQLPAKNQTNGGTTSLPGFLNRKGEIWPAARARGEVVWRPILGLTTS